MFFGCKNIDYFDIGQIDFVYLCIEKIYIL